MGVVQNMINNQEKEKRKRVRLLLTHDNKDAQISSHVAAGFLQVFPHALRLLHNFLASEPENKSSCKLITYAWSTSKFKDRSRELTMSGVNNTNLRPGVPYQLWHQIPDVVYHVIRWKREWVPGCGGNFRCWPKADTSSAVRGSL